MWMSEGSSCFDRGGTPVVRQVHVGAVKGREESVEQEALRLAIPGSLKCLGVAVGTLITEVVTEQLPRGTLVESVFRTCLLGATHCLPTRTLTAPDLATQTLSFMTNASIVWVPLYFVLSRRVLP